MAVVSALCAFLSCYIIHCNVLSLYIFTLHCVAQINDDDDDDDGGGGGGGGDDDDDDGDD